MRTHRSDRQGAPALCELRPAERGDADQIGELIYRSVLTYSEWMPSFRPVSSAGENASYALEHLEQHGCWMHVADVGGQLAGVVSFIPSAVCGEEPVATELSYLKLLFVSPERRGSGLAGTLLDHARLAMLGDGFSASYLWTAEGNARARRFYEREGWWHDGAERYSVSHRMRMVRYRTRLLTPRGLRGSPPPRAG